MAESLDALEQMWLSAQDNLDDMLGAAPDQTHRDQVQARYDAINKNYLDALTKSFQDDAPVLQSLVTQAHTVTQEIKHIDEQLGDIAKVLQVLEQAVSIGSQIVAFGTAVR